MRLPILLLLLSSLTFAACSQPASPSGVNVCAPLEGVTYTTLHTSVAGGTQITTIEDWVDGVKVYQTVACKPNCRIERDETLASGSHRSTIYAKKNGVVVFTRAVNYTISAPPPPSQYGNVGDPYEGGVPDPNALPLSDCAVLNPNLSYRLTRSLGTNATATCLTVTGANIKIDLGGFMVTGRINGLGYPNINGTTIFNGRVTCDHADNEGDVGCVVLSSSSPFVAPMRVHHLTVANTNASATVGGRQIHIEWGTITQLPNDPPAIRVDHITGTVTTFAGARNYALSIVSRPNAEVSFNDFRCTANIYACQAQMCYGNSFCKMHDNRITMDENVSGETGRALLWDLVAGGEGWNNLVIANNNRAARVRDSHNVRIHNNIIKNVTGSNGQIGAFHIADPDSGFSSAMNVDIFNNSLEMNGGWAIMTRGGDGITFHDNTFTSIGGGRLANVRQWGSGTSAISLLNNPTVTVLPSPQTNLEVGTTAAMCNSGTAGGAGIVTNAC